MPILKKLFTPGKYPPGTQITFKGEGGVEQDGVVLRTSSGKRGHLYVQTDKTRIHVPLDDIISVVETATVRDVIQAMRQHGVEQDKVIKVVTSLLR